MNFSTAAPSIPTSHAPVSQQQSHPNRRKKASAPKKHIKPRLQQVEDSDGWTHVRRTAKINATSRAKAARGTSGLNGGILSGTDGLAARMQHCELSAVEMSEEHERYRRRWESSGAEGVLREKLAHMKSRLQTEEVRNVVCLALGSVSNIHLDRRGDSHLQLAALDTIREVLGLEAVPCVMQDPVFSELDRKFLESKGYQIVEDPQAFELVEEKSLLYMIHPERNMYGAVLLKHAPAVFISQDLSDLPSGWLEESIAGPDVTDVKGGSLLDDLVELYTIMPFLQLGHTFSGVAIHCRKG